MFSACSSLDQLLQELGQLGYPHVRKLSRETTFCAGQTRFDLLEWLFSKFDAAFYFGSGFTSSSCTSDSERVVRLAHCACCLGLAEPNNLNLMQGTNAPQSENIQFLSQLIELVRTQMRLKGALPLHHQYALDSGVMSFVAAQQESVFSTESILFPPDIQTQISTQISIRQKDFLVSFPLLQEQLEQLRQEISRLETQIQACTTTIQQKLPQHPQQQQQPPPPPLKQPTESNTDYGAQLDAKLRSLGFLISQFEQLFDRELSPWMKSATHTRPQLLGVGPAAEHVLVLYNNIKLLLDSLSRIRSSFEKITSGAVFGESPLGLQVEDGVPTSDAVLFNLVQSIHILEETLERRTLPSSPS